MMPGGMFEAESFWKRLCAAAGRVCPVAAVLFLCWIVPVSAVPVEINGDEVQYSIDGQKVIVIGNVEIKHKDEVLTSEYAEFEKSTGEAYARGHVVIRRPQGNIITDEIVYNFNKGTGRAPATKISNPPFYITGKDIQRLEDTTTIVRHATYTTSDYDEPEYHWAAARVTAMPPDGRIKAEHVRLKVGNVPIFYWPVMYQELHDGYPAFQHKFGYSDDWGAFFLNRWHYVVNDSVNGTVFFDYRELKDFAWGVNTHYETLSWGEGMFRSYYMNERERFTSHWFEDDSPKTVEAERYTFELRHLHRPDKDTAVFMQVAHLKDDIILRDYFDRGYDPQPATFVSATRNLSRGAVSARVTPRINDWYSQTEYLPEVRYDLPDVQVADSGVYWTNTGTTSFLTRKNAGLYRDQDNNTRMDWDQRFSYPFQAGFMHLTPFVGSRHTYYRKTTDDTEDNALRNLGNTGMSASTKFFKTYDVNRVFFGREYEQIRHIITPEIRYTYAGDPTIASSKLRYFDDVDLVDTAHNVRLSLDNSIRMKNSLGSVKDVMRTLLWTTFNLEEDIVDNYGWQDINAYLEVRPVDWVRVYMSGIYDTDLEEISSWNTDVAWSREKWSFSFGHRYDSTEDDLMTAYLGFRPNRKWTVDLYVQYDSDEGLLKRREYAISRDLHAWIFDVRIVIDEKGEQDTWFTFRLKNFGNVKEEDERTPVYTPPIRGQVDERVLGENGTTIAPLRPGESFTDRYDDRNAW